MSKEKKLTEKEQKRLEIFENKSKVLQEQGYSLKKLTVSNFMANVGSLLVTLPFVLVYIFLYILRNGLPEMSEKFLNNSFRYFLLAYVIFMVLIVVHEAIHGITWKFFVKDRSAISFGFNKAAMAPYCTCALPLKKYQYIIGALMPTICLGFILGAVTIYSENFLLFIVACLMFIGGGGDFLMVINLLKNKVPGKDVLYYDHPTEIGTVVFYK